MRFVVLALATWRFANMVLYERGPWEILTSFRLLLGVKDDNGNPYVTRDTEVTEWLLCIYCRTVLIGALMLVLERYARPIVDTLALSALAVWFDKEMRKYD